MDDPLRIFLATCADGWVMAMDRCYYFSETRYETAANMTDAMERCKSMHTGANLVSVRNKAEQDVIYGEKGFDPGVTQLNL